MSDIIQLLPDSVANQIAAGEVIQRDTLPLDLPEALAIVRKTIKFNFPVIREVVFTIDGEIPVFGETAEGGAE